MMMQADVQVAEVLLGIVALQPFWQQDKALDADPFHPLAGKYAPAPLGS